MLAPRTTGGPAKVPGRYVMVLERPARVARAGGRTSPAVERRKAVLLRLLGAVPFTGLLALLGGGFFTTLFIASLIALVAYVGLLLQINAQRMQTAAKVRRLPQQRRQAPPAERMDRRPRAVGDWRS